MRREEDAFLLAVALHAREIVRQRIFLEHERRQEEIAVEEIPAALADVGRRDAIGRREALVRPVDGMIAEPRKNVVVHGCL